METFAIFKILFQLPSDIRVRLVCLWFLRIQKAQIQALPPALDSSYNINLVLHFNFSFLVSFSLQFP